ncbi:MAG: branched-chain amino acid ABC transporter permease [Candidatus Lokiarchaeota archaeon]|nr:branched-chain amino acid ABC transporter permease [Candidatus Lokiarchaeota archaeon]
MAGELINMLFNGTLNGAVLSLIALGYSLIYGVGGIMNLAHGAFFMLGGYFLLWGLSFLPGLLFINVLLAVIIVTILGGISYLLLIKPLQESHVGVVLITFGLAFAIEQIVMIISGTTSAAISQYMLFQGFTNFLGFPMLNQYIFFILASLIIVSLFALFISKSKLGKSIRAVSQDREAASLMGINSNRILLYTVMISAFLASISAVLYLPGAALNGPSMGWEYLTSSFAVVILGGMGSLVGSIVGAYIVGFITSFTNVFIPNGPSWAHIIPIIVIVVVLLIRPRGLFGKKELK